MRCVLVILTLAPLLSSSQITQLCVPIVFFFFYLITNPSTAVRVTVFVVQECSSSLLFYKKQTFLSDWCS